MELSDNEAEHLNPINIPYFLSILIPSALAFIFGLINFIEGGDKSLPGALLFWSIASFFFIGIMWKEYIHKPKSVVITDDGLLLKLRFGREVRIRWEEILWISASPEKGKDAEGVSGRVGAIKANRSTFYSVSYEIGRDARERYIRVMGRRPLTRAQYIKLGKGRPAHSPPGSST